MSPSRTKLSRTTGGLLGILIFPAICCCVIGICNAAKAQEIQLGVPAEAIVQPPVEDTLIESEAFEPYRRLLAPLSLDPVRLELISTGDDRPEFPNSGSQLPPMGEPVVGSFNEPLTLDWDVIDDVVPLTVAIEAPRIGCRQCGSAGLHARSKTTRQRLASGIFAALCPCDECYQPKWDLQQSAAFFVDSARPQTRTRFGWDYGANMILADRAEYFWARSGALGPPAPAGRPIVPEFDYHELSMFTEVGTGKFSFFTNLPYRSLYLREAGHEAGFADMSIGTKSLVHDSPLLQIAFQMTTHIPSAQSRKGLGVGHVSLEPALLFGIRMTRNDLLQVQLAQWIPIGGDPDYAGALARWGVSWNRLVWALDEETQMTTNIEVFGWSFQDGAYTDPVLGAFQRANDETYVYLGPGLRLLICNKFEIGLGGAFALTERHFAESLIRSEITLRF